MSFLPFASLVALSLLALGTASSAQRDKVIRLRFDPETKEAKGDVAKPKGALLDPRDLPSKVLPYIEPAVGLEGIAQSLMGRLGRQMGFVLTRKEIHRKYHPHAKAIRDEWNAAVGRLLKELDPETGEIAGIFYHDTGRRLDLDGYRLTIVNPPKVHFEPVESTILYELLNRERLIATFQIETSKEDAALLYELIESAQDEVDAFKNPWFSHAQSMTLLKKFGSWKLSLVYPNPFEISAEEFMKRCRDGLREGLVKPLLSEHKIEKPGELYFNEGPAVLRVVPEGEAAASSDSSLTQRMRQYSKETNLPGLLIEVPAQRRYTSKSKLDPVRLSLTVPDKEVEFFRGPWPLR